MEKAISVPILTNSAKVPIGTKAATKPINKAQNKIISTKANIIKNSNKIKFLVCQLTNSLIL